MNVQFLRFVVVGIGSNLALYILYLALTYNNLGHKFSMSLAYVLGIILSYLFNKNWSFEHKGQHLSTFSKFTIAYLSGYLFNLAALYYLVDKLGFAHQLVQGIVIIMLALIFFVLQRNWIFRRTVENTL